MPEVIDYACAGYFITKRVERPPHLSSRLLPEKLFSASGCICRFIPDTWCLEWTSDTPERRTGNARTLDLSPEALKRLTSWATAKFGSDIGWPNVCRSLEVAREVVRLFIPPGNDMVLFGLGLHRKFIDTFCDAAEPPKPQEGHAPIGRQGVHEAVLDRLPLVDDGTLLGFEPLVFNQTLSCSWLCNGLDTVVHDRFAIVPNSHGFLENFDDACRVVDYISQDGTGAEPGLWLPWLIVEYPAGR